MLWRFVDLEHHAHLRIKGRDFECRKIGISVEYQPVGSCRQRLLNEEKGFDPPIFIGPGMAKLGPCFIRILLLKRYSHSTGGGSARCVENVC